MDVRLPRVSRRQDPDQEGRQAAGPVDDQAGVVEVIQEQPGQAVQDGAAPPVVNGGRDGRVVTGACGPGVVLT
ncbi:MAG TPA: hypothetical protein VIF35_02020, partial [Streptosporangiaceae bacterium]